MNIYFLNFLHPLIRLYAYFCNTKYMHHVGQTKVNLVMKQIKFTIIIYTSERIQLIHN